MPGLRGRIKAAAQKTRPETAPRECKVIEARMPLPPWMDVRGVSTAQVNRLGAKLSGWDVNRALFLDTETTGLHGAGTVAFLVGMGWVEGDEFVVRQLLMRDYPEEAHLLMVAADTLARFHVIVSFNGKSFDVPLLRDRFAMARLRHRWREFPQLDLLHPARRTWRLRLGACPLCMLEEKVLGIGREGDLPGAEVPERYFAYLKSGDLSLLDDVLRHNLQDIHTLAALLLRLAQVYDAPERQASALDVFSAGRALERCGEGELARRCFRVASVSALSQQARLELAKSYRREREYQEAAETYRGMIARGEGGPTAYISLAILLERYLGDAKGALEITQKALWRYAGDSLFARADADIIEALERRRARLRRKAALEDAGTPGGAPP